MTTLFFKKPVALDRSQHRNLRMKPVSGGYRFAANFNSLPITVNEISATSSEYPVVFASNADGTGMPVVLLGVREGENLFVDAEGKWDGFYIPSIVRCYPFALQEAPNRDDALIVIDADYPGFDDNDGTPIFDDKGAESPQLKQTIDVLQHFYRQERSSQQFVALLNRHGLLMTRKLDVTSQNGTKLSLDGFSVVDEDKMLKLDDASLLELTRSGALGLIYAHLNSLTTLHRMMARLEPRLAAEKDATRQ